MDKDTTENKKEKMSGRILIVIVGAVYLCIVIALYFRDSAAGNVKLTLAQKDGYWGYVDDKNNLEIDYLFKSAGEFTYGHAIVTVQDYKGVIDKNGEYVIEAKYADIKNLKGEYVLCKDKENIYYIISTQDTKKIYASFSEVQLIEGSNICIVKSSDTGLYGLFVDGDLKYDCEYNSIEKISNNEFKLQRGTNYTTYDYSM